MSWQQSGVEVGEHIGGAVTTKAVVVGGGVCVWAARNDTAKKCTVCALVPAAGDEARERFLAEAGEAKDRNPIEGVVQVVAVDPVAGGYVAKMAARTTLLEVERLEWRQERRLLAFRKIVAIVARLHGAGIVHGWLRPENVWLDATLEPQIANARALDVATVCRVDPEGGRELRAFVAPEVRHGATADARGDVYALGRLLQFVLLGAPQEEHDERLPRVDSLKEHPNTWRRIVRRCVTTDVDTRYADATELVGDLDRMDVGGALVGLSHPDFDEDPPPIKASIVPPPTTQRSKRRSRTTPAVLPPVDPKTAKVRGWSPAMAVSASAVGLSLLSAGMIGSYLTGSEGVVFSALVWASAPMFALAFPGASQSPVLSRVALGVVLLAILVFVDPAGHLRHGRLAGLTSAALEDRVAALVELRAAGETVFRQIDLAGADLSNMDLSECALDASNLRDCTCIGTNLNNASTQNVDVTNADFSGANLVGALPQTMKGWLTITCDAATTMPTAWVCDANKPRRKRANED